MVSNRGRIDIHFFEKIEQKIEICISEWVSPCSNNLRSMFHDPEGTSWATAAPIYIIFPRDITLTAARTNRHYSLTDISLCCSNRAHQISVSIWL